MNNNEETQYGEFIDMSDAPDDIEADIFSIYLNGFFKKETDEEKCEELARRFKLPIGEIKRIIYDK